MRNPLSIAASYYRSWIETRRSDPCPGQLVREELKAAASELGDRIEQKIEAVHSELTLRIHDLYAETWRLRDDLDGRLATLEKRLEESASRYETSILEVDTAAGQVLQACRSLTERFDLQYAAAEREIESLRETHDRRLRHLEQSHRTELAQLELQHEAALRGECDARKTLAARVQDVVAETSLELSGTLLAPAIGAEFLTPIQRLSERLQPRRRVRQLEGALSRFEQQMNSLRRAAATEEEAGESEERIMVTSADSRSVLNGNGNGHAHTNGNGHGEHSIDFALASR